MKKTNILVLRGLRNSTQFKVGRRTIELKSLYKALTSPGNYKELGIEQPVVATSGSTFDIKIEPTINVDGKGFCTVKASVTTTLGTQKIVVSRQLNTTNDVIANEDLTAITKEFFDKIELPVAAEA